MHVQIGDLDEETRKTAKCDDRSVADIVAEMTRSEDEYQERYAQTLGIDTSTLKPAEEVVPLPLSEEVDEEPEDQNDFEHNRAQTIAICAQANIEPLEDASNRDLAYARNRVRHTILPELERINPQVRAALARLADAAAAVADADRAAAERVLAIDVQIGVQLRVERFNAVEHRPRHLDRAE